MIERIRRFFRLGNIMAEFDVNSQSAINFMEKCIELSERKGISYNEAYRELRKFLSGFITTKQARDLSKAATRLGKATLKSN